MKSLSPKFESKKIKQLVSSADDFKHKKRVNSAKLENKQINYNSNENLNRLKRKIANTNNSY